MKLVESHLDWSGASPASGLTEVARTVMGGDIVILKRVYPESLMDRCKAALLDWQSKHPASNPERLETDTHWWRRDVDPPSKSRHLFETFCFVFDGRKDSLAEVAAGSTKFRLGKAELDTTSAHDIGDICLFRYDLDHAVGDVDRDYPLERGGTGRWTMVLPLM